ncbi:MAG: hypothetical protein WCO05_01310 [Candidatus Moraniibacteriota bacterium]|jgi:hypothetical protein
MAIGMTVIWVFMLSVLVVLVLVMKRKIKTGLEDWIAQNSLNYKKEVVTNRFINSALFNTEPVSFRDVIWGQYGKRRVYLYTVIDSTGATMDKKTFFNGSFYSKIKAEDIDKLLANENYLKKRDNAFGSGVEIEIPQLLVADVYLKFGTEVEYLTAQRIHLLLEEFADLETGLMDKWIGIFTSSWKIGIEFNGPEAIDFVLKNNVRIKREIVEQVADAYERFSLKYDQRRMESGESLKDIDMSKFK